MRSTLRSTLSIGAFFVALAAGAVVFPTPALATYAGPTIPGPPPPPPPPPPPADATPIPPGAAAPANRNVGCLWTRRIYDWRRVDDSRIIVKTGPTREFMVTFNGSCRETRHSHSFFVRRSWGSCLGAGDILVFQNGFFRPYDRFPSTGCWVSSVSRVG